MKKLRISKNELNELQKLYKDGIIAESEYRKKLKGIKEKVYLKMRVFIKDWSFINKITEFRGYLL